MGTLSITKRIIKKIEQQPEAIIKKFNLIYVNNRQLSIIREKNGKEFVYVRKGEPLIDEKHLDRIKGLVIPPAWEKVKITHLHNGHLQAVGRDAKKRKQYRYHPLWEKLRNQTKFYKMAEFGEHLSIIRKQIDQDIQLKGWPKEKVLALVIKLMEETHIRVGNSYYAKKNKTYGLTTLRSKHVHLYKDKMYFDFVGKKGKEHRVTLRNKKLVKLVAKCEEIPGWELFQYYDDSGEKHAIDSGMVNSYLFEITGKHFTAKDFRTWSASLIFYETLMDLEVQETQKDLKSNILLGYDAAAEALGNTRAVCRKYYVHPTLVENYDSGKLMKAKPMKRSENHLELTDNELVLLKLLKNFKVEI